MFWLQKCHVIILQIFRFIKYAEVTNSPDKSKHLWLLLQSIMWRQISFCVFFKWWLEICIETFHLFLLELVWPNTECVPSPTLSYPQGLLWALSHQPHYCHLPAVSHVAWGVPRLLPDLPHWHCHDHGCTCSECTHCFCLYSTFCWSFSSHVEWNRSKLKFYSCIFCSCRLGIII